MFVRKERTEKKVSSGQRTGGVRAKGVRIEGGRMGKSGFLRIVCAEGEGQKIEFKAKITTLAKEMVAFANASGGSLFLGISDDGKIVGVDDSNRLRSQIQDVANGCDPRIGVHIVPRGNVVEIVKFLPPLKLPVFHRKERNFADGLFSMARHQCRILWELFASPRQLSIGTLQN